MGDPQPESRRILLIDDEADVRTVIKSLLEMDTHVVSEAGDAREALDLFARADFDLVITDYRMPGMLGDELAEEIKRRHPELPVIMITGNVDIVPGQVPGVDLLLLKPFQITEFRKAIRKVSKVGVPD